MKLIQVRENFVFFYNFLVKWQEYLTIMWKYFYILIQIKGVNMMEVTDVRLRRVNTDGRMKAIASITIDHEFVVHDIRVIDGNNGMFVAMPSKRTPDGEFRDIAHPISSATREKIQAAVLSEYDRVGLEEEDKIEAGA